MGYAQMCPDNLNLFFFPFWLMTSLILDSSDVMRYVQTSHCSSNLIRHTLAPSLINYIVENTSIGKSFPSIHVLVNFNISFLSLWHVQTSLTTLITGSTSSSHTFSNTRWRSSNSSGSWFVMTIIIFFFF